jgi:hypothetical protein
MKNGVKQGSSRGQKKPQNTKRLDLPSKAFRTATGAGHRILEGIDGRCAIARRYAEVAGGIAVDLGGEDQLTELQKHLIRSVAGLVVLRERLDAKAINGERVNSSQYCRLANSAHRVAATLGITRVAKDVTPTPLEYAREFDRRKAQEAEEMAT